MPTTSGAEAADRLYELLSEDTDDGHLTLIATATVSPRRKTSTKKSRNDAWKTLLVNKAEEGIRIFRGALTDLRGYFGKVDPTPRRLTDEEAWVLMTEYLAGSTVTEAVTARREQMKDLVREHVAQVYAANDVPDPYNKSGVLRVPSLGKRFCIEGAGFTEPRLDEDAIRTVLSEDEWDQITDKEVIPERRTRKLNIEKLTDLLKSDRTDLVPVVRDAVIPGEPKNPSFTVRDDEEENEH